MQPLDDWELVARAQRGDRQAFAELVRRYQDPVVHFCQRMVGPLQDAEDLAQEAFVRLHRHLPRLRPQAKFSTFLFGVARNLALNHLRDGRRRGREGSQPLEALPLADIAQPGPDRAARLREIETLVAQCLEELSPEHREVLLLRDLQNMDYDSIAKIIHCRVGTVKSRIARAREQLRLRLIERGGDLL
ncbi:MAG: sigma-70 family RNA polymerase sigma factor [Candidatus Hydrogenedentes bacterium]|nr:sigma-70 family RNA polymerase sigma factor [Candidatus Hydrogenedentota bacterium]